VALAAVRRRPRPTCPTRAYRRSRTPPAGELNGRRALASRALHRVVRANRAAWGYYNQIMANKGSDAASQQRRLHRGRAQWPPGGVGCTRTSLTQQRSRRPAAYQGRGEAIITDIVLHPETAAKFYGPPKPAGPQYAPPPKACAGIARV